MDPGVLFDGGEQDAVANRLPRDTGEMGMETQARTRV